MFPPSPLAGPSLLPSRIFYSLRESLFDAPILSSPNSATSFTTSWLSSGLSSFIPSPPKIKIPSSYRHHHGRSSVEQWEPCQQ